MIANIEVTLLFVSKINAISNTIISPTKNLGNTVNLLVKQRWSYEIFLRKRITLHAFFSQIEFLRSEIDSAADS